MAFFVRIPRRPDVAEVDADFPVGDESYLNIINGDGTLMQRELRRKGYAGYEPPTAATMCAVFGYLREQKGSFTFYDVGANGGHYAFLCKSLFHEQANVVAFEPAPNTFGWLRAINLANHLGVVTEQMAMSDTTDDVTLYLSKKSDASNSLNKEFKDAHRGTVTVRCTTLDLYVGETSRVPDFLKIDTESHEINVLRGGAATIREHRPMFIIEAIAKGGVQYGKQVSDFLDEVGGYHYYRIGPAFTLEEHDSIFARPKSEHRDWLVVPFELPRDMTSSVAKWAEELSECTVATNITDKVQ